MSASHTIEPVAGCCEPAEQESCCEPSAKSSCCGAAVAGASAATPAVAGPSGCGCR